MCLPFSSSNLDRDSNRLWALHPQCSAAVLELLNSIGEHVIWSVQVSETVTKFQNRLEACSSTRISVLAFFNLPPAASQPSWVFKVSKREHLECSVRTSNGFVSKIITKWLFFYVEEDGGAQRCFASPPLVAKGVHHVALDNIVVASHQWQLYLLYFHFTDKMDLHPKMSARHFWFLEDFLFTISSCFSFLFCILLYGIRSSGNLFVL